MPSLLGGIFSLIFFLKKSRIEISKYCKKIVSRGDGYYAVQRYLERMEVRQADQKYILQELRLWEERNPVSLISEKKQPFDFSWILGIFFIVGGIVIAILLWDKGLIGTTPLILVGVGITMIFNRQKSNSPKRKLGGCHSITSYNFYLWNNI